MNAVQRVWTPAEALAQVLNPHTATVSLEVARLALSAAREQAEAEQLRQERHHDIMARVVERLVIGEVPVVLYKTSSRAQEIAGAARAIADAAYPPPKVAE